MTRHSHGLVVDAWMQHPSAAFRNLDLFKPLLRWTGADAGIPAISPEQMVSSMDAAGVDVGLICAWYGPQGPIISNDDVASVCATAPERLRGMASVDIRDPVAACRELRRRVLDDGMVALRILPWLWEQPSDYRLFYPLYATCVELDVPVCMQVGQTGPLRPSEPGRPIPYLENVCLHFPDLKVVGGHIGAPWTQEMIYLCTKFPNVYIDTSAYVPKRYPRELVSYMKSGPGAKKVLFGTNFPMIFPTQAMSQVDSLGLDTGARELFLGQNAVQLFKLQGLAPKPEAKL